MPAWLFIVLCVLGFFVVGFIMCKSNGGFGNKEAKKIFWLVSLWYLIVPTFFIFKILWFFTLLFCELIGEDPEDMGIKIKDVD